MQEWDHATDMDENTRPGCEGKSGLFTDYDSPFGDHSEAKAICDTCPMFGLCAQYAREVKPAWGVWAGKVWVNGRTRSIASIYTDQEGPNDTEPGDAELGKLIELGDLGLELELVG